jgi:hypothetical protein
MDAQQLNQPSILVVERSRRSTLLGVVIGAILTIAAFQVWQRWSRSGADPIATTLATFERANRLTVFTAQLATVVVSEDPGVMGYFKTKQVAVIPARVDYNLDLSELKRESMTWDGETQKLKVMLPPLALSKPNLDEGHAQYLHEGMWIGRETQVKFTHDNTLRAETMAAQQAGNAVLMGLARDAAREAVRQNLTVPLQAAGFDKVSVEVKFAGER